jgi:hypothetical protein
MSKPYIPVPVEAARQISSQYEKSIVIINAWDHQHKLMNTTTYGVRPQDKISAARGGETCAKALGLDLSKSQTSEDFRTVDAARNAQLRDLAERAIHVLRSYQFGNSAVDLAKKLADDIEAIIRPDPPKEAA